MRSNLEFAAILTITTLAATACVPMQKPYEAFKVPAEDVRALVQTVALIPAQLSEEVPEPDTVRASFEPMLAAALTEAGYAVVAPQDVKKISDTLIEDAGPLFDPVTGEAVEGKGEAIGEYAFRELESEHGADAALSWNLIGVSANWTSAGGATFCGAKRSMLADDMGFWDWLSASGNTGTVGAVCLVVSLIDMQGKALYEDTGGIDVLAKLRGSKFETIDVAEALSNDEFNYESVRLAFAKMLGSDKTNVMSSTRSYDEFTAAAAQEPTER